MEGSESATARQGDGVSREELVLDPLSRDDERRLRVSRSVVLAELQLNLVESGKELQGQRWGNGDG
jgi:hypothetical protein